jgi:type I restriction enzyme M protein
MSEQIFKNIDDVLWKEAGCSSEPDYTECAGLVDHYR